MSTPSIIIAAPQSSSGKTIVTLGILRALRRRGLRVRSFKVGPDYIDPAFHARASGEPTYNVDSWAMRFETLAGLVEATGHGMDLVVGEGVMGLFDGATDGTGSTADIAALFGLPVILVVDVSGMGASVAALVDGFRRHREDVDVAGVVFNRAGSPAHADLLARATFEQVSTPVLGSIRRDAGLALPSRHLGLVQAVEHAGLEELLEHAATVVEESLDLDRLVRLAKPPTVSILGRGGRPLPPLGQAIAVARDEAFAFAYDAVLEAWRRDGASLHPFSPLADEPPPPEADAVFLPGGYPELHAGRLAANHRFLGGLRRAAERGAFVYGECGGYMALGRALIDREGHAHQLAGLLPVVTSFAAPRLHLGYRQIELLTACALGGRGQLYRGHEFHYAAEVERGGPALFGTKCARGQDLGEQGCRSGSVAGSFLHLIDRSAGSRPAPRPA